MFKANCIHLSIPLVAIICVWLAVAPTSVVAQQEWGGEAGEWKGFTKIERSVDGRSAYVVIPKHPAPGNPWVWRARFPGFHDEADLILLQRGYHVAHINTNGMLGSDRALEHWDEFYQFAVSKGLARQVALEAVSRGGLFAYRFAARWPERVACIYADTPVCDFKSWPLGQGKGKGAANVWQQLLKEYDLTEAEAMAFTENPIDILEPIATQKIPLLHIVSLNDVIVPPKENTFVLAQRYRELGGRIDVIEVKKGTAKSNGHHFSHPDPVRVADFIERHASVTPDNNDYFVLRNAAGALTNSRNVFRTTGKGRVAFVGGSITEGSGWRNHVQDYLMAKFPKTEFDFVDAGISSTGSTPAAFRLQNDVLGRGKVDLLFEEAAVNDLHNMRSEIEMRRGMEGVIRRARSANPKMDIVVMHFVDPKNFQDYHAHQTPRVIRQHEAVAEHYNVSTLHLAREVSERIDAQQFTWKDDFKNLHPSPFGHRLYASSIRRMLSMAWDEAGNQTDAVAEHKLPATKLEASCYDRGRFVSVSKAALISGFRIDPKCDPRKSEVGGGVRKRFFDVPMLVGTTPGARFQFEFQGRGIGLFTVCGPDAGVVEFRIDGGDWQKQQLFTKWSRGLHLPWAYVLGAELRPGNHLLEVRIAGDKFVQSKGNACRIVHFLVND